MTTKPDGTPKLSIVVPFYNVEDYFEECLDSLERQTMTDLEVIMVDDGSPDGSEVIAKSFAARDPRFRLVRQDNQGLGPARNTGVRHATGEYLAFADSDDRLPAHAYERMVGTLEETGSDLVTGGVDIFNSDRRTKARFYGDAFAATRKRTHIGRDTELLHDRTAWNKVYRRSFYDAHGFTFPPGAYEDAAVTIPAHVLAENVDVLADTIYHYRQRDNGDLSITQRRTEIANLRDRISSVRSVSRFLAGSAPRLKNRYDLTCLDNDLMLFINVIEEADDAYRHTLCTLVGDYLNEVDPVLLTELSAIKRLKYHLAGEGRADDLVAVREYERTGLPAGRIEARGLLRRRWYAGLPFRGDRRRAVPEDVYDVTAQMRVRAQVDEIVWEPDGRPGVLRLAGRAYVPGVDMTLKDRVEVWLQHTRTRRRIRLRVQRVARPDVTPDTGQPAACYDGCGFVTDVDLARLKGVPGWRSADWRLRVAVRSGSGRHRRTLRGTVAKCGPAAAWAIYHDLPDQARAQVVPADGGVALRVRRVKALATGHRWDGDTLEITGRLEGTAPGDATASATSRERGTAVPAPVEYGSADGGHVPFTLRLPLDRLGTPPAMSHWDLWLVRDGKKVRLTVPAGFAESAATVAGAAYQLTRTRYGNLTVGHAPSQLVADTVEWTGDGRLAVGGHYAGAPGARPAELVLRRRRTGVQHAFPLVWDGDRFTAGFDPAAVTTLAGTLPLAAGKWDLTVAGPAELTATRRCLAVLPGAHEVSGHHYRLWPNQGDGLHISARIARPDDERGAYAQRMLRERDYPAFLRAPLRDLIVFESYFGWQYSCNPKALYEEFRRRDTGHELVWVMGDQHFHLPGGGRAVQRHSREYYEVTAAARMVVNNVAQPTCYQSRPGQTYLQTWHGTPIKTVGFDMDWSRMERRDQRMRELTADVSRWDLLLSQNPFSTTILRSAFRYDGEILESGYPRNDLAHRDGHDEIRAAVRDRLGVPAGKRVVLYAPTWRDNLQTARHGLRRHDLGVDLARVSAALGDDTVLLVRRHHLLNAPMPEGCVDVTRHPDVVELYLAADVLVTDYSSAMCDFAGLGKPILLYTPDLDAYRHDIRGFTFDIAEFPPGPILLTTDELIGALADLAADPARHRSQLTAFADMFCPHDDGNAAARVVDHLIARGAL
ncbi:bifunctional glycosyltransferase family 2 protein/CDP-glycerol:glycerophosphate glycerophosphotransferase [Spirillospora sp. NPDC047279]|uniref:bifunctional glycosyltransferase/CDP-glycerol:glycerophosphate glycerophosphotransferase n=1 Tax=Spirillospora sp. NPDC047279 TaxID=3155478 RepID=UPI003407791C